VVHRYGIYVNGALGFCLTVADGPWDLRDFFAKQAFISRIIRPTWIPARILDVREAVGSWYSEVYLRKHSRNPQVCNVSLED
jgi:hypothetical protein